MRRKSTQFLVSASLTRVCARGHLVHDLRGSLLVHNLRRRLLVDNRRRLVDDLRRRLLVDHLRRRSCIQRLRRRRIDGLGRRGILRLLGVLRSILRRLLLVLRWRLLVLLLRWGLLVLLLWRWLLILLLLLLLLGRLGRDHGRSALRIHALMMSLVRAGALGDTGALELHSDLNLAGGFTEVIRLLNVVPLWLSGEIEFVQRIVNATNLIIRNSLLVPRFEVHQILVTSQVCDASEVPNRSLVLVLSNTSLELLARVSKANDGIRIHLSN
jgi:hypothetical protein